MNAERMTYSYKKVYACCKAVKALAVTCNRKCEHFSIACEMERIANHCYDETGDYNFVPKYTPIEDYRQAAYYSKNYTKKELDGKARTALRYLQNELNEVLSAMATGEVNAVD